MKNVIILGAGASKSYSQSKTSVKMPVAIDFFETFRQLDISSHPWVLIGNIINYISRKNKTAVLDFLNYTEDIEILHSEIQEKLYDSLQKGSVFENPISLELLKAFNELIFLFVNVINEIQNGEVSNPHLNLARQLSNNDSILTFNWDTLMDRALTRESNWNSKSGYYVTPTAVYQDQWVFDNDPADSDHPLLLKLHGSSNWLTSHILPGSDGKIELSQETKVEDFYVYESNVVPYSTYAGRYFDGYEEFSYGYYPPNLPLKGKPAPDGYLYSRMRLKTPYMPEGKSTDIGLTSMPLIIPPVKAKEYDLFGSLFKTIWEKAQQELEDADKIYVIGYSFPVTDVRTDVLFKSAFLKRDSIPQIIILNPEPDGIIDRFKYDYGIPESNITVLKQYFDENFKL